MTLAMYSIALPTTYVLISYDDYTMYLRLFFIIVPVNTYYIANKLNFSSILCFETLGKFKSDWEVHDLDCTRSMHESNDEKFVFEWQC